MAQAPDPSHFADTVALLRSAQQGCAHSLDALVSRYRPRMLNRIRMMMGQDARRAAESEDFLQGVMVDIVANLRALELRDERSFLRWATQVARNNIRDSARKCREDRFADFARSSADGKVADGREVAPPDVSANNEAVEDLMEALEKLPPDQQLAVELRDFDDMSFAQIGRYMQRSEDAAQAPHTRALIRLGRLLQGKQ